MAVVVETFENLARKRRRGKVPRSKPITMRFPAYQVDEIKKAAALEGVTFNYFVQQAAVERARQVRYFARVFRVED